MTNKKAQEILNNIDRNGLNNKERDIVDRIETDLSWGNKIGKKDLIILELIYRKKVR